MKFKIINKDAWEVKQCENIECNIDLTKNLRHTIYKKNREMHIVCYKCHVEFWKEMKEKYPNEIDLPKDFKIYIKKNEKD